MNCQRQRKKREILKKQMGLRTPSKMGKRNHQPIRVFQRKCQSNGIL